VASDVRGTMIWFNEERDEGYISTEEGERLFIAGPAFTDGLRPQGRVGGRVVEFEVADRGGGREAFECALVDEIAPPRARRRRRG
jgi:cold shock CspA family protein